LGEKELTSQKLVFVKEAVKCFIEVAEVYSLVDEKDNEEGCFKTAFDLTENNIKEAEEQAKSCSDTDEKLKLFNGIADLWELTASIYEKQNAKYDEYESRSKAAHSRANASSDISEKSRLFVEAAEWNVSAIMEKVKKCTDDDKKIEVLREYVEAEDRLIKVYQKAGNKEKAGKVCSERATTLFEIAELIFSSCKNTSSCKEESIQAQIDVAKEMEALGRKEESKKCWLNAAILRDEICEEIIRKAIYKNNEEERRRTWKEAIPLCKITADLYSNAGNSSFETLYRGKETRCQAEYCSVVEKKPDLWRETVQYYIKAGELLKNDEITPKIRKEISAIAEKAATVIKAAAKETKDGEKKRKLWEEIAEYYKTAAKYVDGSSLPSSKKVELNSEAVIAKAEACSETGKRRIELWKEATTKVTERAKETETRSEKQMSFEKAAETADQALKESISSDDKNEEKECRKLKIECLELAADVAMERSREEKNISSFEREELCKASGLLYQKAADEGKNGDDGRKVLHDIAFACLGKAQSNPKNDDIPMLWEKTEKAFTEYKKSRESEEDELEREKSDMYVSYALAKSNTDFKSSQSLWEQTQKMAKTTEESFLKINDEKEARRCRFIRAEASVELVSILKKKVEDEESPEIAQKLCNDIDLIVKDALDTWEKLDFGSKSKELLRVQTEALRQIGASYQKQLIEEKTPEKRRELRSAAAKVYDKASMICEISHDMDNKRIYECQASLFRIDEREKDQIASALGKLIKTNEEVVQHIIENKDSDNSDEQFSALEGLDQAADVYKQAALQYTEIGNEESANDMKEKEKETLQKAIKLGIKQASQSDNIRSEISLNLRILNLQERERDACVSNEGEIRKTLKNLAELFLIKSQMTVNVEEQVTLFGKAADFYRQLKKLLEKIGESENSKYYDSLVGDLTKLCNPNLTTREKHDLREQVPGIRDIVDALDKAAETAWGSANFTGKSQGYARSATLHERASSVHFTLKEDGMAYDCLGFMYWSRSHLVQDISDIKDNENLAKESFQNSSEAYEREGQTFHKIKSDCRYKWASAIALSQDGTVGQTTLRNFWEEAAKAYEDAVEVFEKAGFSERFILRYRLGYAKAMARTPSDLAEQQKWNEEAANLYGEIAEKEKGNEGEVKWKSDTQASYLQRAADKAIEIAESCSSDEKKRVLLYKAVEYLKQAVVIYEKNGKTETAKSCRDQMGKVEHDISHI